LDVRNLLSFNRNKVDKTSSDEFISMLKRIKEGDSLLREDFLSKYTPFMLKITSKVLGKYIDIKNSDEYSIALSAFNEAIDCYDMTKNYNFLLFSEHVIKKRLIDYMRKNKRNKEFPFSYFDDEGEMLEKYIVPEQNISFEDIELREELIEYKECLADYGITLVELISNAPKHSDSRRLCIRIAKILADDEELFRLLQKYRNIPRNELKKKAGVHSRTIGLHRKYIIALCLIFRSNLELSKSYLSFTEEGGR
jgi:RNA polymerase sigma factor